MQPASQHQPERKTTVVHRNAVTQFEIWPSRTSLRGKICLLLPRPPYPSQDAYTIIIQPGGGRIMASDERQLDAAVQALLKTIRRNGNKIELPIGLMTNYPVIGQ